LIIFYLQRRVKHMLDNKRLRELDQGFKPDRKRRWRMYLSAVPFGLVVGILTYVLFPSLIGLETTATATATIVNTEVAEVAIPTSTLAPTETSTPTAVPEPTLTPTRPECIGWQEVTLNDVDSTLCVQGEYQREYLRDDGTYVMVFSEEVGSFQIWAYGKPFSWYLQGVETQCVVARGKIYTSGVRPIMIFGRIGQMESCK
jgi:hypothetical protein